MQIKLLILAVVLFAGEVRLGKATTTLTPWTWTVHTTRKPTSATTSGTSATTSGTTIDTSGTTTTTSATSATTSQTTTEEPTTTTTEEPVPHFLAHRSKCLPGQYATMTDLEAADLYQAAESYCASRCDIPDCQTWIEVNDRTNGPPLCLDTPAPEDIVVKVPDYSYERIVLAKLKSTPQESGGYVTLPYDLARDMSLNITAVMGGSQLYDEPGFLYTLNLTGSNNTMKLGYDFWFQHQADAFQFRSVGSLQQFRPAFFQERRAADVGPIYVEDNQCVTVTVYTLGTKNTGSIVAPIKLNGYYYCNGVNVRGDVYEQNVLITNLVGKYDVTEDNLYLNQEFYASADFSPPTLPVWHEYSFYDC